MDRRIVSKLSQAAGLVAVIGLASACQDLNSFVTGEKFLLAPKGTPRVEVEVAFVARDDFYTSLEDVDRERLEAEMEEIVLSLADVGLRFFPVSTDAYGRGDERPERMLVVEVDALELTVDEKTVEEEGQPMTIVARIAGVRCRVRASVEKRRDNGPELVVGSSEAFGSVRVRKDELAGSPIPVRADVAGHAGLYVEKEDVLAAFEEGVVDALRDVVKAVDRDLAAAGAR